MAGNIREKKLTPKQERFVAEYLIDLNATQAAIRAGYSKKTAEKIGSENLSKPEVRAHIDAATGKRLQKAEITGERVLNAIAEIAFGDIRKMFNADGALTRPQDWDDETAAAVAGLEVVTVNKGEGVVEHVAKIKRADRLRALDMLARHHSLYNDKLEVNVIDNLAERVARAKKRATNG
ncbi:terminase small subunit [Aminobacter ciceronei]|uniref:Phage terminase small subunit n=1 Tax=Aminobacter ciceronei TaxID=150723 RepID=A0ABR6C1U4_9HYPH|nr:terminase small subunit [Aminobacter ciceronei]MBA8904861.1 phage terminase small subunit [Aminobacter ciceronei]MBA9018585.1 phage terminase small subunit [Aminobacter ciceronei]